MREKLQQELKMWLVYFLLSFFTAFCVYWKLVADAWWDEGNLHMKLIALWGSYLRLWVIIFLFLSLIRFAFVFLVYKFKHKQKSL
jgi:hypothetical protein